MRYNPRLLRIRVHFTAAAGMPSAASTAVRACFKSGALTYSRQLSLPVPWTRRVAALCSCAVVLHCLFTAPQQVASEHKKSEALVTRIITAAVQRARNLDSMNQGLAEQLQRARTDIAQVARPSALSCSSSHLPPQLLHERNEHAHGRRAADDKVSRAALLAYCYSGA